MESKNGGLHVPRHQLQVTHDSNASAATFDHGREPISNLHCFLQQTTPVVPIYHLSKRDLHSATSQWHFYFSLGDLWERFDEWSAYGAGVPIVVKSEEVVTQYFVPYLSGIQLYSSSSHELTNSRRLGDDSDASTELDFRTCCSELSTDSESEKMRDCSACTSTTGLSSLEEPWSPTTSTDSRDSCNSESLLFQYFESQIPAVRVPLYENIKGLSKQFPALQKLCSHHLSPSSWMSVVWYPIYRIPTGVTLRHFSTCFLTFHSLSTSLTDDRGLEMHSKVAESVTLLSTQNQAALQPFGLASYKFKHSIWTSRQEADCKSLIQQLQEGADTWVKQLNVSHPDLIYFTSRGTCR